jgi:ABC-type Zn2+ transport system substrate-binding protein/surface adhesin
MRVITFSVFAFLAVFAQAEKRLAGAHVHGLNYVQIISDGSTLQVNYEFPIAQLQEHDEHKDDEHKDDEHKDDEHKHEEHEHDEHENVEPIAHIQVELKPIEQILNIISYPDSADCT